MFICIVSLELQLVFASADSSFHGLPVEAHLGCSSDLTRN